jgi:hypothetical protein
LPLLSLVDLLHATGGGFGSWWLPFLLVAHLCWAVLIARTFVLAPCFLFSPFLGCFLSIKFGRVSSAERGAEGLIYRTTTVESEF